MRSVPGSHGKRLLLILALVALVLSSVGCGNKTKKPGSCNADKDCAKGLVCAANKCVECAKDSQCPSGKTCKANACVAKAECERDDQCPNNQVCQAGKCKACSADADCGPGGSCNAGACKKATKCTKDDECADDEDCVAGFCRKATATAPPPENCKLATIYFNYDDASIQASERDRLESNAQCIEKTKGKGVLLFGHTDSSGTEEYNIALSERRAQTVADYLAKLGADPARLQVIPKGETEPTGLGDEKDRRCDFGWK